MAANPKAVKTKRRELWGALRDFIHQQAGWVTSVPGQQTMRLEIPKNSTLPAKLVEFGCSPRHCGMTTRITAKEPLMPLDILI
jgi:hypothetical protein